MVKKSRRFAISQAALARRKKTKRPTLTDKQREIPGSTPASAGTSVAAEQASSSGAGEAVVATDPSGQGAMEVVPNTPWRYAYVLSDIRRIGILAGAILTLIVALSFFLR